MNRNKAVLVAGGAGFVGSNLCRRLLSEKMNVLCLDNLSTGCMDNISSLLDNPCFSFVEHDIIQPFACDDFPLKFIYNFACPASPLLYQRNPVQTYKTSVIGNINLLELAKKHKARILLASTSEIYGDAQVAVQSESYWGNVNPYGPRSCYDEGKRGAETLFHDYNNMYAVDTRIIRIFNTYGPMMRADDGRVVSNFIVQALRNEPLTIYGAGSHTRSFQYIDDLLDAIMLVMQDDIHHAPINIGNPNEISVSTLAKTILELTHSQSAFTYKPLPQDDPHRRCPDISLANKVLSGWSPKVNLTDGLTKTIEYFKNILHQ